MDFTTLFPLWRPQPPPVFRRLQFAVAPLFAPEVKGMPNRWLQKSNEFIIPILRILLPVSWNDFKYSLVHNKTALINTFLRGRKLPTTLKFLHSHSCGLSVNLLHCNKPDSRIGRYDQISGSVIPIVPRNGKKVVIVKKYFPVGIKQLHLLKTFVFL